MVETGSVTGILALALIGGIGVAFTIRRFAPQLGRRLPFAERLQPLGLLSLTPQCSVALVRVGQDTLVLGVTPHTITLLAKMNGSAVAVGGRQGEGEGQEAIISGGVTAAL